MSEPFRRIAVAALTNAIGAEITGVDLRRVDDETVAEIRRAFLEYLVVFFRDQHLTVREFEAFALRFGEPDPHRVLRGMEGHPNILEIVRKETDPTVFAPGWHADVTWQERPVLGAMLYGVEVPKVGGDTAFSNQYLAYERLSPGMRRLLDPLRAVHSAALTYGEKREEWTKPELMEKSPEEAMRGRSLHPVVRTHPETGRKALFVNRDYVAGLEDMTDEESASLLEFLYAHAVQPEFSCRFRWREGSIAFWDNRCTLHKPIDDYFGLRRRTWRITLAGDRPR